MFAEKGGIIRINLDSIAANLTSIYLRLSGIMQLIVKIINIDSQIFSIKHFQPFSPYKYRCFG